MFIGVTVILAILLCKSLIGRPLKLIKENRILEAELKHDAHLVQKDESLYVQDSLNIDVGGVGYEVVVPTGDFEKVVLGGCVLVQGKLEQIAEMEGMELIQYKIAFSGTYAGILMVWKEISSILPDPAHITSCKIVSERDKDRKGWSLVCKISIQTIRII